MAAHARLLQSLRLISRVPDLRDAARCIEANAAAACLRGYASVRLQQGTCHSCSRRATADAPRPSTFTPLHRSLPASTKYPVDNAGSFGGRSGFRRSGPRTPTGAPSLLAAAFACSKLSMRLHGVSTLARERHPPTSVVRPTDNTNLTGDCAQIILRRHRPALALP